MTRRPAGTALVVLDFSGTLSIAAVRFAAPDRIDAELRRSGLWALGIDSPELFWERLIDPTWSEGSTTTRGYTAVLATVAAEVLHERGRSAAPEAIRRCVSAFADRYLACSTIAPQWRGFLQRLSARDDAAVVVATEHYAEATGHITAELARIGARGVPVTQHRSGSREVLVANSAELGCDKSSARYWQLIHRALAPATVSRVVVIDDFGANEAPGDPYAEGERVRRRRAAMTDVLTSVFRVPPDVYPFVVRTDASPADLADLVADAGRSTMNVLSSHWRQGPCMQLPVMPPISPMLAKNASTLPTGEGWMFEPKWDGFRCLVFRDGDEVELWSRHGRSFNRYFPELPDPLREQLPTRVVLDGELVVPVDSGLSFDLLGQRIHPAESRVRMLAETTPARYVAFDVLAEGEEDLRQTPFGDRRARLERILADARPPLHLTPATRSHATAQDWFERFEGAGVDGIIAKPTADPYTEGERSQLKLKHQRTADVVVAGMRWHKSGNGVGSLLLGLYRDGHLQHIGVAAAFSVKRRVELESELEDLRVEDISQHPWAGWTDEAAHEAQRLPGAPSRWSGQKDAGWVPLRPERVAEVEYNQLTEGRLRHPAKLVRWRPDKPPDDCTYEQLEVAPPAELDAVFGADTA